MFFDFYWFREQLCLIACPYGRFQSVLLDKWSLIVSYDRKRGEPRGRRVSESRSMGVSALTVLNTPIPRHSDTPIPSTRGDCIDCHLCVATCPTGIDIRDGLQMECINCTQCIDACDAVMEKIGRPRGLIRYSSQAAIEGEKVRVLRPRVVFYPALLAILITVWIVIFSNKGTADVTLLRNFGNPFTMLANGQIANSMRLKVQNRTDKPQEYAFQLVNVPEARIVADRNPLTVAPDHAETQGFVIEVPLGAFAGKLGTIDVTLRVTDGQGFSKDVAARLLGPMNVVSASPAATRSGAEP